MVIRRFSDSKMSDALWVGLSLATILVVSLYVYHKITFHKGFNIDPVTWTVVEITNESSPLQLEDRIIRIGQTTPEQWSQDRAIDIFRELRSGEPVDFWLIRDGELLKTSVRAQPGSFWDPLNLAAAYSTFLFWLMGTAAAIFLRPRDDRWLVLILCFYNTAMWIAAGVVSYSQVAYSAVVFHLLIWWFLPLSVHLHLIMPNPLFKSRHKIFLPILYLGALALDALDFLQLVDVITLRVIGVRDFLWAILVATVLSLGLMTYRLFVATSPAIHVANRLMLFGVILGFGPVFVYSILSRYLPASIERASSVWAPSLFLTFLPLWPLSYIYAIYKHNVGKLRYRANRLLGGYGFLATFLPLYAITFMALAGVGTMGEHPLALSLFLALVFVAAAPYLRRKFQLLVDRQIFGLKYVPNEVISAFAARIPAAFSRGILTEVISEEIVPTLLIKESTLYYFGGNDLETIYRQEPTAQSGEAYKAKSEEIHEDDIRSLLAYGSRYLPLGTDIHPSFSWVRLVVPLIFQNEPVGIWLLGQRDPDDYYPKNDIELLNNLANQIAPVIENVRLVEIARRELEENKRLQQQLLHSQKMEAIGSLSAGIAHDFNNLLSVILGNSYLLLDDYEDVEGDLGRFLGEIRDAGERATSLTRQLLTFSRQTEMDVQVVSLSEVIDDMAQMLRLLAGKEVELELRLGKKLPFVRVDPGQMGQVIVNLVVNARDAMPDGGRLTVETSEIEHESGGLFAHVDMPAGSYVWLQVADTGTGLDPEISSRIFEPFFTTKEVGKGTGLGLSMVYGIVNQSKGHVFVESEPDEGTSFHIFLPTVADGEAQTGDEERKLDKRSYGGEETILVVEDEESVLDVTCTILRSHGYTVLEAGGGEEAIEVSEDHDGTIDLLLTDIVMPGMKGPELASRIVGRRPGLDKVLFMSGYHDDSHFGEHLGTGEREVMEKPFSPQELSRRIRKALDEAGPAGSAARNRPG